MTMDPKEKAAKVKEMEEEIATIDAQIIQFGIQQKQQEIEKEKAEIEEKQAEEEKNKVKNGDEVRDGIIISASLKDLIKAGTSLENISRSKEIKTREAVEACYLGPTDNPNSFNAKRMVQIKISAVNADMNIANEIGIINTSANNISEKMNDKADEVKKAKKEEDEKINKEDSIEENR